MQDAATPERLTNGKPTFASLESEKARDWFSRAGDEFAVVCDCADLDGSAVAEHAQDVIESGCQRRRARKTIDRPEDRAMLRRRRARLAAPMMAAQ